VKTKTAGPEGGFNKIKKCPPILGFSNRVKYWIEDEFDYLELNVSYENRDDLPITFGGLSGGGIWRVVLNRLNDGKISYSDPLLIGVAFYETSIVNKKRSIIGHGWRSIYEIVPSKI
jgi:hypothetical protein